MPTGGTAKAGSPPARHKWLGKKRGHPPRTPRFSKCPPLASLPTKGTQAQMRTPPPQCAPLAGWVVARSRAPGRRGAPQPGPAGAEAADPGAASVAGGAGMGGRGLRVCRDPPVSAAAPGGAARGAGCSAGRVAPAAAREAISSLRPWRSRVCLLRAAAATRVRLPGKPGHRFAGCGRPRGLVPESGGALETNRAPAGTPGEAGIAMPPTTTAPASPACRKWSDPGGPARGGQRAPRCARRVDIWPESRAGPRGRSRGPRLRGEGAEEGGDCGAGPGPAQGPGGRRDAAGLSLQE